MLKKLYQDYIIKYYKLFHHQIMIGLISLLIISYSILIYQYENKIKNISKKNEAVPIIKLENVKQEDEQYYYVDIKGAVLNPSVYKVKENARVMDVITLAGGLIEEANTSVLNLSKKVTDEMVIIIYTNEEIKTFVEKGNTKEEIIKYVEKECKCPEPKLNGACINNNDDNEESNQITKVSINTASKEELMTLSGIGESKAKAIIDYRDINGLFSSVDDIKNVTGIGDSVFDKIKDYITI